MKRLGLLSLTVSLAAVVNWTNAAIILTTKTHDELKHPEVRQFVKHPESLLLASFDNRGPVVVSHDGGKQWTTTIDDIQAEFVCVHPTDGDRAYVYGTTDKEPSLYVTSDRGKHFDKVKIPGSLRPQVGFSLKNPEYVLVREDANYYASTDYFKSDLKLVMRGASQCEWVLSSGQVDPQTILCVLDNGDLVATSDLGNTVEHVQIDGEDLKNVNGFQQRSSFIVATLADSPTTVAVTSNWLTWSKVALPLTDNVEPSISPPDFLVTSNNSIHLYYEGLVDVSSDNTKQVESLLLTSDESGQHFSVRLADVFAVTRASNEYFDNVLLATSVDQSSKVSYDDARTWEPVLANCVDGECRNLYLDDLSLQFPAPGVIAALGNMDTSPINNEEKSHLFISLDSGTTWNMIRSEPQLFAFINSGYTLVSAPRYQEFKEIHYSNDFGSSWKAVPLKSPIRAVDMRAVGPAEVLIEAGLSSINFDFSGQFDRTCDKDDFQEWYTRYNLQGEPDCVMGAKGWFLRLKEVSSCLVSQPENYHSVKSESCGCELRDYECSANLECDLSSGEYVPPMPLTELTQECARNSSFVSPSIYSLIPGNKCSVEKGLDLAATSSCSAPSTIQEDTKVKANIHKFDGDIADFYYAKTNDEHPEDETILVRTTNEEIYVTHDQGGKWKQLLEDVDVVSIYPNPYFPDVIYFLTAYDRIYYTTDRGKNFHHFDTPISIPVAVPPLSFSKEDSGKVIFVGEDGCDKPFSSRCTLSAYYSTDHGKNWESLETGVNRCTWISGLVEKTDPNLILCDKISQDGKRLDLVSSTNFFDTSETKFENIVGYALEHEFIVVAKIAADGTELEAFVSVDGQNYAEAKFPYNFRVDHQQAYTILESITNAIFLHVTVSTRQGSEYGSILKSNSNGTDYVISLENVNRNTEGYVDFEKMQGLEGVALVNVVSNAKDAKGGARKKLKTMITHNDGAEWMYLTPPDEDSEGKGIGCSGGLQKCSLNLHGYTERTDYRDTYSSGSAVGLMIGVGNVGEHLSDKKDGNTYLTRDGGIHWKEIKKGAYMWEYGDSGSIIALVNGHDATNTLYYSLDEGNSWQEFTFSEYMIKVDNIATIPSDTSRKFVLFGRLPAHQGAKSCAIQVDFSDLLTRKCNLDEDNGNENDFELWTPSHPALDNDCLFGHEISYHRKIPGRECYIGRNIGQPHKVVRNCTCARQDFECDFNYQRANDGSCQLVPGFTPPDHSLSCHEMPGQVEYWEPTGYRRIPLSTCQGGEELDKVVSHPCPGKEAEYDEKHRGLHGFALFIVIMLPIGMALMVGFIVWDHYSKRYGQIRLGEDNDDQPAVLRYAVIGVAGAIAFLAVIPGFFKTVYIHVLNRIRSTRYTSRSSLQRNLQYSPVDVLDDGELLRPDESDIDEEDEEDIDNVI